MEKIKEILKKILILIIIPIIVYLIFWMLCRARGVTNFGVGTDFRVIMRNTVYTGFIALAVSDNLASGRFDFSIGSTLILSSILGTMITLRFDLGPVALLLLSLLFGLLIGTVSGLVYAVLRLPPMVVTLGLAMIYEAIAFNLTDGAGVKLIGNDSLLIWSGQPYVYVLCITIVAVLYILLNKTQFGFNTQSLRSGQEIAVNVGINEKKNAVICFTIGGLCMAAAGIINLSVLGTVTPELGLGSAAYIQNAFMPMFIGNILAKYFDRNTGVIIGALTQSIIFAGIGKLGVPSAWQSVITGIIVLVFFAYSFNAYKIVEFRILKEKKAKARSL